MALAPLPEEILDRFRSSSRNRLSQVTASWQALTHGHGNDEMTREMHRNVHTLKGDARMVQFHDIDLVCQKLEDLLSAADSRQYQVSADFDLVVDMALDFIGLLLRRRGDQEVGGINLEGFVEQVNQVLRQEIRVTNTESGQVFIDEPTAESYESSDRVSQLARQQLAIGATKVFLEYLSASGVARTRLRSAWSDLQQQIERFDSVPLVSMVNRHVQATKDVAESLGHTIELVAKVDPDLRISCEVLHALDVALMHGLRNALSHGLGAEQGAPASSALGRIEIDCETGRHTVRISIRDDGVGIDLECVRVRAVELGVMHPDVASRASQSDLIELLFQPRFSTRHEVSSVSGRGIGLDALRTAVRKVGGEVSLADGGPAKRGCILTIELPLVRREIDIHAFDAYGGRLVLAVSSTWKASWRDLQDGNDPIDPIACLQIRRPADDTGLVSSGMAQVLCLQSPTGMSVELVATKSSRTLVAERICPTPETFPVEVVTVAGVEVLLLRPDKLPAPVTESTEWQP